MADDSADIFVLVDESHRSQYGDLDSLHARMREVFPNACLIGFTGTPIAKKERNTFLKFGTLARPVYSMKDAVEDGAVVPLVNRRGKLTPYPGISASKNDPPSPGLVMAISGAL